MNNNSQASQLRRQIEGRVWAGSEPQSVRAQVQLSEQAAFPRWGPGAPGWGPAAMLVYHPAPGTGGRHVCSEPQGGPI